MEEVRARWPSLGLSGKLGLVLLFLFWFVPYVPALHYDSLTVTRYIKRSGKVQVKVGPREKSWTKLQQVSLHLVHAMIASEDARFRSHHGLDVQEVWASLLTNMRYGRYARGASTITQQVVKMTFLTREKSLVRKAREVVGALLLEAVLDKDEILAWYLNLVEFGDGVYGVKQGAAHYFGTKPELLTVDQAVHLALVLPSPNRWSKGLRARRLTPFGHKRFAAILQRMRADGYITAGQWQQAMATGNFGSPISVF